MGVGTPDIGHVVKAFTPDGKLLLTLGVPGNNGTSLRPLQFGREGAAVPCQCYS